MIGEQRTILVTFAGRCDRKQLLIHYVGAAIERGLIGEGDVSDFARDADDAAWLQQRFPVTQTTPNNSLDYCRSSRHLELQGAQANLCFSVRATNDVLPGVRRVMGEGPDYAMIHGDIIS
jgi:hypothetical protein